MALNLPPLPLGNLSAPVAKHIRMLMWAMSILTVFILGMVIWLVQGLSPQHFCALAKVGSPDVEAGCANLLLAIIITYRYVILAFVGILGIVVFSFDVVLLGVRIKASGPNGLDVDISADKTRIQDGQGNQVTTDTPPSGDKS